MLVRLHRLLPALALGLAACSSDVPPPIVGPAGPIDTPLPASLQVGDLVRVNVNAMDACTNATYHIARVEAIGDKSLILADTANPKGGFTTTDFQRYAAKFDTLIYPLDAGAFGAPTDIDGNGRVGIIFTRAVNELTDAGSNSYVGGFTFSRDLFPRTSNQTGFACATSNQGEFFYALAPDPNGVVNGNKRTTGFVDSATVPVLAHELQHLINASRKIYVSTTADQFEMTWLDEGLAHIAEELLFYREAGITPRTNLDSIGIRSSSTIRNAFNSVMLGNAGRYQSYLLNPSSTSPYASGDSLSTRGAAWDFLRYLADQKASGVTRNPAAAIEQVGTGSVSVPGTPAGAEYYVTLVNSSTVQDITTLYGISATNVITPAPSLTAASVATLSRAVTAFGTNAPVLQRDARFEGRLRAAERALGRSGFTSARQWYRDDVSHVEVPQGGRYSLAVAPLPSPDGDVWFRLVNNSLVGIANVQQVFGITPALAVSDWSASNAVDDVSLLVGPQFLEQSWSWRGIYPALRCTGCASAPYPLTVRPLLAGTPFSGSILSGGAAHFKIAVAANASATVTVTSTSADAASLRLEIVRTK